MEARSVSKLLSEKMRPRCAFSQWSTDLEKPPALHSIPVFCSPTHACTVLERSSIRAGDDPGQIQRVLGRHRLPGVRAGPEVCKCWAPTERAVGVTG